MRAHALRHSIGTKIFGAFLAMCLIVAGLGAYGYYVLSVSEGIVADTYDHPLMAINFARAASVDFLQMENEQLRDDASARDTRARQIDALAATLSDDLDVADDRSTASDERRAIASIRVFVRDWQQARHAALSQRRHADLSAPSRRILDEFDTLIELNADHGFISRREAVTHVRDYEEAVIVVTAIALLLAGAITIFLARRIVRPLSAAALVADRIAAGQLQTAIPLGGRDETGALLNSMQVMQNSIAAQMAREHARAQSAEGRLLDAVESSGEEIVLVDADGLIAVSNSGMARLFPSFAAEIVPGQVLSNTLDLIDVQCTSASDGTGTLSDTVTRCGEIAASAERQLPDGRWLRITASRTSEGGAILFFSDFTDIKAREEKYRIATQQAESASAAKSRFLANMSHELRTPLNAVIGFSEILSGEMFGPLGNPRYTEYSSDILHSARHLLDVINSVLDLAKSDAGHMELRKRPVDLNRVSSDCARMLHAACERAGLSFTLTLSDEPVIVDGDKAKLRQIFLNLLSNAIKFTESGGAVELKLAADDTNVRAEVRDTGIGMSTEGILTALAPFGQVDNRLERRYDGTGLGLPLANAFVELHGGTLVIDSAPGRGTTVAIQLARCVAETNAYEPYREVG